MTRPDIESGLVAETMIFGRALREHGLAVTPSEIINAVTALSLIDLDDRQETRLGLRSILTSRPEDFPIFEELFEGFWNRLNDSPRQSGNQKDGQNHGQIGEQTRGRESERRRVHPHSSHSGDKGLEFWLEYRSGLKPDSAGRTESRGASDVESSAENDFGSLGIDELDEISRLARRVVKRLARSPSRRWQAVRRGPRIDLRRMLRRSLKTGGELIELSFKRRRKKKTRLVVICDVSGSMEIYTRLLLQFVYGLQNSLARVETFVFSTSLERITGHLKDRTYQQALERLTSGVRGWSGGTLIGSSIAAFNSGWPLLVDRRTIVLILSDGWDTGTPQELTAALADLKRRAGKLIWLNPLLGSPDYQPLARGMQAALPHLDVFAPLHNLASLRALEQHLKLV